MTTSQGPTGAQSLLKACFTLLITMGLLAGCAHAPTSAPGLAKADGEFLSESPGRTALTNSVVVNQSMTRMQINSWKTQRVRAAVLSAFADTGSPPRPASDLVRIPREMDRESAELFRKERYGLSIDTSEAAKYEQSVQDVAFGVLYAVRGMLEPDPCMLYNKGADLLFNDRRHALSDQQARAICAYLGMLQESRPAMGYAEVLQRGWRDVDCEETRQAARQINEARNYSYDSLWQGAADHAANLEIVQAIRDAFRGRARPAPDRIVEPNWIDERCEPGLKFRDADWDRIHPSLLNSEDLLWFTEEARDYFLPSYFLADAHGAYMELDLVLNYVCVAWFRRLSVQQQSAVIRYLQWRAPTDSSVAETLEKLKS